ncbi:MAG: ABC transporter substrate-binding protein [Candidatus Eisenbacteria bacterium]|nr:ABC transporter substrate-binding protein [Candidatus Latescibacterota bacterium]MBD3303238.1 ABC transporter substrate-binding protein [Candidatus Eisenbacteria bacterium]
MKSNPVPGRLASAAAALLALSLLLGFPVSDAGAEDDGNEFLVVCSTTQVADFARQVAGDRAMVHCVLTPGADPHLYEPRPGDARIVARADLVLQNGLHLEGKNWMETLAHDAGKPVVTCADGIEPLRLDAEGKRVDDPHAWFDPANAVIYVRNVTEALARYDPERADEYRARADLYIAQLRALHLWTIERFHAIPPERRILVTSHDAFNYFCRTYDFTAAAPVGWSTGAEVGGGMSPERRRTVVESIKEFDVPAIFVETTVNPKLIREIAREAGVEIGGELYSDSMGPVGSAGETYIGMMRENTLTIAEALGTGE